MNAPYASMSVEAAERAYNRARPEFTQDELDNARDELTWEILGGKTRAGFDLAACLDCEFNSDGYTGTVNDLATLMRGEEGLTAEEQQIATACAVHNLAYKIVFKHIPESAVEARAEQIESDRAEAAQCSE